MTRLSAEMLSQDGEAFPNILRIHTHGTFIYLEIEAKHDGHKVCSTVKVERAVFVYHLKGSGILS